MLQIRIQFTGNVQGVGFRARTLDIARNWNVTGYVRNEPNGKVLVVAEGDKVELEGFKSAILETMSDYIRSHHSYFQDATLEFSQFRIAR